MRPYLVLCVLALCSLAVGQDVIQNPGRVYGPCIFGCGPFVPLVTTPSVSLVTVAPNPVGASNATTGLYAGATNATLSQIPTSTSSEHTEALWYEGGSAPLTTSDVHLWTEPVVRHSHPPMHEMHMMGGPEHEARAQWVYFSGTEHTADAVTAASAAKGGKKAARSYTNADVERQNQNNGEVKYKGKTEKM